MTDVRMTHTADGGEVTIENGIVALDPTLATAAYLSLFGGNSDDNGTTATEQFQWWGNLTEPDPSGRLRSETQSLLTALPITPSNRLQFQSAAERDLAWMVGTVADSVAVEVTMPGLDRLLFAIVIIVSGVEYVLEFESPEVA